MRRAVSIGIFIVGAQCAAAGHSVLAPGATPTDCRSVLRIGIATCEPAIPDSRSVSEAQVAEYLAQYGKPPREAVRALLDPSDRNIAAWIRKQRQVISVANYVATRMTEMQSQLEPDRFPGPLMPLSQLPAMVQMRATLFLDSESAPSLQAAHALQQVVGRYPSLDGRLVQVGPPPDTYLATWLAKLGELLPISIATADAANSDALPSLLIEDLRYGTSRRLDASHINGQQICDQIIALRVAAETRDRLWKSAWPVR
jgi:hypothetical protein